MKVVIIPDYNTPDKADGGIRRVVEAQKQFLPTHGIEVLPNTLENLVQADLVAVHAGSWPDKGLPPRTPVVAHCHGLYWEEYEWQKWHYMLNEKVIETLLRADATTAPSHWVAQALRRNFYLQPTVLWHGVNIGDWSVSETPGSYVLWNKAREDAVCDPTPVAQLAKRAVTTNFITTFAPPDKLHNITIVPPTTYEESKALVRNAGVYLCTTRETFGVGTLEAMASGVPILGWNYGGQAEFVEHGVTGWLAEPGDYDSLAEGLAYCLNNRARLGTAARARVAKDFTWEAAIEKYAMIYKAVVDVARAPTPRTSIIVTNYNLGKYLPTAIDSVLAQDDPDFEVLLIDDASTEPGELDIVRAQGARDPRIRVIEHPKNLYLAESLNDGLNEALGRYILPLDADNQIAPQTLSLLAGRLDADRDADITYGSVEFIDPNDSTKRFVSTWPPSSFDFRAQLSHRNQIPSTAMYRKRVGLRVGGYRPRCRTAEDADFWCRVTSFGARPVKATDAITLIYLDRLDSMSRTNVDWPWEAWYTWSKFWDLTPPGAFATIPLAARATGERPRVISAADPLVSVVIPVGLGHERKLLEALDSLQAQTMPRWEAIVVNDTGAPLSWIHPWAKVVSTLEPRSGPAHARNTGMEHVSSTTKHFIFLDADDYLEPNALERMYIAAHASDASPRDFIYTDWIIDEERRTVAAKEWNCEGLLRQLEYPVTALYPISAWKDSGGFDTAFSIAWEDWDYALRIANRGYCGVHLPEALLHYRMSLGERREAGFAQRETLKKLVFEKWQPYIEGQETLMACSSCGKRAIPAPVYSSSSTPSANGAPTPDAVLVEYISLEVGPLTYIGKSTGTKYRFGRDSEHRLRYVRGADVSELLRLEDSFKLAEGSPALVGASA